MLVCAGDSITADEGAWPSLVDRPVAVTAVKGASIIDTVEQVWNAPDGEALILTVGTNDVLAIGGPLDYLDDAVRRLCEAAGRFPAAVWLDVVLFTRPGRYWHELDQRRKAVRASLHESGIPSIRPCLGPLCWQKDCVHPNQRGQKRIAAAVERWLTS